MGKNVRLFKVDNEKLHELLTLNGIYPILDNYDGEKHTYHYAKCDEFYAVWDNRNLQVAKEDLIYYFDRDKCRASIEKGNRLFKVRTSREGGMMYLLIRKDSISKYIVSEEDKKIHQKFVETANLPTEKKVNRKPITDMDKALANLQEDYDEKARCINKKMRDR